MNPTSAPRVTARLALLAAAAASPVAAAPITYTIDQPWEFSTSNTQGQDLTNLTGWVTFDPDVQTYAPTAWHFELTHFDPVWSNENGWGSSTVYTPLIIAGSGGSYSFAEGFSWVFRNDVYTSIRFGWAATSQSAVLAGEGDTVNFLAYEYVQRGPIASQRSINAGQATLVPEPGSAALCILGTATLLRRRRRN